MSEALALLKGGVDAKELLQKAKEILEANERDGFIMPNDGYYDGVWLWDTGFIVLGESYANPERAAERLLSYVEKAQWKNGFIPHILYFGPKAEHHSFGPEYWEIQESSYAPEAHTTGITQPPVLGFAALKVYENLKRKNKEEAEEFLTQIYPKILAFHRYLYKYRDLEESGLVSIYHPWESGLDNLPNWEDALERIEVNKDQINEVIKERRDTKCLTENLVKEGLEYREAYSKACEMRPTNSDYARYVYLLRFLKDRHYDDQKIYNEIPFNVKSVLFNSLLYVSTEALLEVATYLQKEDEVKELENYLKKQKEGLKGLYDREAGLYFDFDLVGQKFIRRKTVSSFAPLFAGITNFYQARQMFNILKSEFLTSKSPYFLIPSTLRSDKSFSNRAYWRGPAWMPTTWILIKGFERVGFYNEAVLIKEQMINLTAEEGFYEYYNPDTGKGLGMKDFSWTASLSIDLINS